MRLIWYYLTRFSYQICLIDCNLWLSLKHRFNRCGYGFSRFEAFGRFHRFGWFDRFSEFWGLGEFAEDSANLMDSVDSSFSHIYQIHLNIFIYQKALCRF